MDGDDFTDRMLLRAGAAKLSEADPDAGTFRLETDERPKVFGLDLMDAEFGRRPGDDLRRAAWRGETVTVERLLSAGEAHDSRGGLGLTALACARNAGAAECEALLSACAELFEAARSGDVAILEELVPLVPSGIRDWAGRTPLHVAAASGMSKACSALVKAGFHPDALDAGGMTPLHNATESGDHDTARVLLAAGADPEATADGGLTPFHIAEANASASEMFAQREELLEADQRRKAKIVAEWQAGEPERRSREEAAALKAKALRERIKAEREASIRHGRRVGHPTDGACKSWMVAGDSEQNGGSEQTEGSQK
jgi:hypothetical protein